MCQGDIGRLSISGDFAAFQSGPIASPIILQRGGRRLEYIGETTIGSGAELRVETARDSLALSLREMEQGSFVIFELSGFATATGGTAADSVAALRAATTSAYFRDGETLWVKLMVEDAEQTGPVVEQVGSLRAQSSITVNRESRGG